MQALFFLRKEKRWLVEKMVKEELFVGETRGLDLKTVTGTEWDKPKKVKEEQQDGE